MIDRLILIGNSLLSVLARHPKRITFALAAVLLSGGGAAFAVASLAPDASQIPVREVLESVQPLPLQAQTEALDVHSFKLFRSDSTRANDTAESLLRRLGLVDPAAAAFIRSNSAARRALLGRTGRIVSAEASDRQELLSLTTRWITADTDTHFQRLVIEKMPQGFVSRQESAPLVASTRLAGGSIRSRCLPPPMKRGSLTLSPPRWPRFFRHHRLSPRAAQGRPVLHRL
ncbi:MAG: hypothetical protein MZW92_59585 [Comamonadaceae bacterium]|nr:hypothetical protein [Comamonadaceae bacterium]